MIYQSQQRYADMGRRGLSSSSLPAIEFLDTVSNADVLHQGYDEARLAMQLQRMGV